jgi:phosphatidylserine/phosphatidylglycerophosphate/cardiolipin synthase-like enzyme
MLGLRKASTTRRLLLATVTASLAVATAPFVGSAHADTTGATPITDAFPVSGIATSCPQAASKQIVTCHTDPNVDPSGDTGDTQLIDHMTTAINNIPAAGALYISQYTWYDQAVGGSANPALKALAAAVDAAGARGVNVHVLLDGSVGGSDPAVRVGTTHAQIASGPFVKWNNSSTANVDKNITWFGDCVGGSGSVDRSVTIGADKFRRATTNCDEAHETAHINHNKFMAWSDNGTTGPFHTVLTSANLNPNGQREYNDLIDQNGNSTLFNFLANYWFDMYNDDWGRQAPSSPAVQLPKIEGENGATASQQFEDITTSNDWAARVNAYPQPVATTTGPSDDPIVDLLDHITTCSPTTGGGYPTWPDKTGRVWIADEAFYDNRLLLNSSALLNAIRTTATTKHCPVRILIGAGNAVDSGPITDMGEKGLSAGPGGLLGQLRAMPNVQVVLTEGSHQIHDKLVLINAESTDMSNTAGSLAWRQVSFVGSHNVTRGSLILDDEASLSLEQTGTQVSATKQSVGDSYGAAFETMWNRCLTGACTAS